MPKTIVVTGATSGIGLAAAEQLARAGVNVIGVGRSPERCRSAEERLRAANSAAKPVFLVADLSLQSEVRALAAEISARLPREAGLDALLNNAGMFSVGRALTSEGHTRVWALNCLAPFLLTHELLPLLTAASAARIVTVSSGAHYGARLNWSDLELRRFYNPLSAYGQSKLANVLFTLELNRRLGTQGRAQAFAADPGLVRTAIGSRLPFYARWVWNIWSSRGISSEESARGIVRLLLDPDVSTGAAIFWKHGRPVAPDPAALDGKAARRLWAESEHMCGIVAG